MISTLFATSAEPELRSATSPIPDLPGFDIPHGADTSYLAHGYFRYIGKFPPQLVAFLLNKYHASGPLLDPMCGGGTTLIEARLRGLDAVGCDVNPVARLVSKVGATPLDPKRFAAANSKFLPVLQNRLSDDPLFAMTKTAQLSAQLKYCNEYFDPKTRSDIGTYLSIIRDIDNEFHDVYLMALLAVLRRISRANVKKMNLEIDDDKKTTISLLDAVSEQLRAIEQRNAAYAKWAKPSNIEIIDADAAATGLSPDKFGTIFLHPPYLTNTAFSEFTQLQLAVLGIDHKTIWKRELRCRGSFLHETNGLKKYLVGWNAAIKEAWRVLRPGGLMITVVGDGQIDYVRIPVGVITTEFAKDVGFKCEEHFIHMLNNNTGRTQSRRMPGQHVAVFRKSA